MNGTVNTPRLIELARWLTIEERKRRQGLDSHWDQGVWVRGNRSKPVEVKEQGDKLVVEGWSCGTAACAAGHISLEDGGLPAFYNTSTGALQSVPPIGTHWSSDPLAVIADTISDASMFFPGRQEAQSIEDHAREALGLDDYDASQLFEGTNSWGTMISLIASFTEIPERELLVRVGGDDMPEDPDDPGCDCDGCTGYRA